MNDTAVDVDHAAIPDNLVDAFRRTVRRTGNRNGVTLYSGPGESTRMGYGELDEVGRQIADALQRRGLAVGEVVVLALDAGFDMIRATCGVIYAGLALAPAAVSGYGSPTVSADRILAVAQSAGSRLVLTEAAVLARTTSDGGATGLAALEGVEVVTVEELLAQGDADAWVAPEISPSDTVVMMFTSGSTGLPKGTIATHGSIATTMRVMDDIWDVDDDSVFVGWAPLHHIMGLFINVIDPLILGVSVVIIPTEQFQRRPLLWLQVMSDHKATMSVGGNFAFALCTRLASDEFVAGLDLSSLKLLMSGSEPVLAPTVREFIARFESAGLRSSVVSPAYGMTEAMLISMSRPGVEPLVVRVDAAELEAGRLVPTADPDDEGAAEMVSCGPPHPSTTVVVIDPETSEPVAGSAIGEIWVASGMISPGYFRRDAETAETFGWSLPGHEGKAFLRTGDLGAVLEGEVFITGRVKDLIIIRGRNIYPQELEAVARRVPGAGIGAAFELTGAPSAVGIVLEQEADGDGVLPADLPALANAVAELVARVVSLPSVAVAVLPPGTLPRTPTGKVKRAITRTAILAGELPVLHEQGFV